MLSFASSVGTTCPSSTTTLLSQRASSLESSIHRIAIFRREGEGPVVSVS
jgi:hypothetical protein